MREERMYQKKNVKSSSISITSQNEKNSFEDGVLEESKLEKLIESFKEGNMIFPFVAVEGQEKIKKALLLNIVNKRIGGVLINGEKGTAKSTLVRGLGELFSEIKVINLPLNITEDNLVGSIDIEKTMKSGKKVFQEGF